MPKPNYGSVSHRFSNVWSIHPELIRDLFENLLYASDYKKRIIWRHRNNDTESKVCDCVNSNFGSFGRTGFSRCPKCKGSGMTGSWTDEKVDVFFWNLIPAGLSRFGTIMTVTEPINRQNMTIYISSRINVKNMDFLIYKDSEFGDDIEIQIMTVRPIIIGEVIVWKWLQCQRQAVDTTTEKRGD